jgi:hypothetical protein
VGRDGTSQGRKGKQLLVRPERSVQPFAAAERLFAKSTLTGKQGLAAALQWRQAWARVNPSSFPENE